MSVVGARPQFIKLAPIAAAFKQVKLSHVVVHTGQHYDDEMSARFFRELRLPRAHVNLGVRGGGQVRPTARMLERLARAIDEIKPGALLVYGDTTSTLAGALAGAQCGVPVAHVEAGLRSYRKEQPEERNRLIADHLSTWLFAPTAHAVTNLKKEGIARGVHRVGDPMHESLASYWPLAEKRSLVTDDPRFLFVTLHRAENTDVGDRLNAFVRLLTALEYHIVLALHPRTKRALRRFGLGRKLQGLDHVQICDPLGYLDTLRHVRSARAVLTDSGGVQREAAWLGTPCLTLRSVTEWTNTVDSGANTLVDLSVPKACQALKIMRKRAWRKSASQQASVKIATILQRAL